MPPSPTSIPSLRARKHGDPIVALTAYTAPFARILDPHADILLVGDSLGMVLYGMDSTLGVTLDMMIAHGRAVARTAKHACVIVDMPFGSYQQSPEQAFASAARVMAETGCAGVKLEGGVEMEKTIRFLAERGIPVMGHVGLMPQRVHALGGYRYQGRDEEQRTRVMADALAVQRGGAFAVVLEGIAEYLAHDVTVALMIPTIGIGASPACDGQTLVSEDMAGLSAGPHPRFVERLGNLSAELERAASAYARAVRERVFPAARHTYGAKASAESIPEAAIKQHTKEDA